MKHSHWLPLTAVFPLLLLVGCGKKEKIGVEYREESSTDTAAEVAEAFNENTSPPEKVDREIETLFTLISRASREDAPIDTERFFSSDAMIEALESGGMLKKFNDRQRRDFVTGFRMGFKNIGESLKQMSFDQHRIARIDAPSETMRVLFVQHYDTDMNITFPMRWWLAKTDAGWRVFDYQDLSTGLRTIELMGILIGSGVGVNPEPWVTNLITVLTLMKTIDMTDPEQLVTFKEPLEKLRRYELPGSVRTFASTMMVGVHQVSQENDKARAELEAARDGGYQSPMWHYQMAGCLTAEERYDDAILELEKHAATFGWDSDSLEVLADNHLNAGRPEESRAAALRGLEDSPGSNACLASLAAASTPEQLRDPATAAQFALSNDAEFAYEISLDYLIELGSGEAAIALFEVFRAQHPDSELIDYYVEELEIERAVRDDE